MKIGIKLYAALLLLFVAVNLNAQMKVFNIPVSIAFEAGYSSELRHGKSTSNTNINGIRIASTAEFTLPFDIQLLTGVSYTHSNSHKTQGFPYSAYVFSQSYGHVLSVPLHVKYELPLFKQFKAFGFVGPTLGIGISEFRLTYANDNFDDKTIDYINEHDILITYKSGKSENLYKKDSGELNRLNLMLSTGGGIRWKNYYIKSGYDFGLTNLNKFDSRKVVQSGWYLMGGYRFEF